MANTGSDGIASFQLCRNELIARGKFINVEDLKKLLRSKFFRNGLPKDVSEALYALGKIVQEVGTAIQVIIAGQQVVTLHELEIQLLNSNKNFEGVKTFNELKLGPLRAHPIVQQQFKPEALGESRPPALTAAMVIEHIGERLEKLWEDRPKGSKLDVPMVMEKLRERHGVASVGALGVIIRSNAFLIGLLGRVINMRRRADTVADKKLEKQLAAFADEQRDEVRNTAQLAREAEKTRRSALVALRKEARKQVIDVLQRDGIKRAEARQLIAEKVLSVDKEEEILSFSLTPSAIRARVASLLASGALDDDKWLRPAAAPADAALGALLEELASAEPDERAVGDALYQLALGEEADALLAQAEPIPLIQLLTLLRAHVAPSLVALMQRAGGLVGVGAFREAPADPLLLIDHLRSILADAPPDQPLLERLADAEGTLLRQLQLTSFEQLHLAESRFLAFCVENAPNLRAHLPAATGTADGCRREAAVHVAAALLAGAPELSASATWALCQWHFAVDRPEELGWVSAEQLRQSAAASQEETRAVPCAVQIAAGGGTDGSLLASAAGVLGAMSSNDALRALVAAPLMFDLSDALHWPELFAPSLGELATFIDAHADLPPMLEVTHGRFIRLLEGTPASFRAAVGALRPMSAAAIATHLATQAGGVGRAPLALLARETERGLHAACDEKLTTRFTLEVLAVLPSPLLAPIGGAIFLDGLKATLPDACTALLDSARSTPRYVRALHALGYRLGITDFVSSLMGGLQDSVAEAPVVAEERVKTITASVADDATPIGQHDGLASGGAARTSEAPSAAAAPPPPVLLSDLSSADPTGSVSDSDGELAASVLICRRVAQKNCLGLEVQLDAAGQSALSELREMTQRAVNRLAADLYSGNVHYVLELIQNADDNTYETGAMPTLCMTAAPTCLTFDNNEVGFSERDCFAICNIGRSTKDASAAGFIGNKGIGFKSVFKASSQPEVHSGQYHLQFDKARPLGYIVPQPKAPPDGWDPSAGTSIILPLDEGEAEQTLRNFRSNLKDIRPTLLLFLHRLRRLVLVDAVGGTKRTLTREHASGDIVTLLDEATPADGTNTGSMASSRQEWLVMREVLEAQGRREKVESTELALAFPLRAPGEEDAPLTTSLPPLAVFAYLPLRSYGLKFLLQADWIVPSSRESVDDSSPWNQWLREAVPPLFQRAVLRFVGMAEELAASDLPKAAQLMNYVMEFVPLPGMTTDFFAALAPACCARLKSCRCILTASGQFVLPAEAVLVDKVMSDSGSATQAQAAHMEALVASSGLAFAHRTITLSPSLATQLGVRRVDASLITEVLSVLCTTQWRAMDDVDLDFLTWALSELQRDRQLGKQQEELRRLRMLPLTDRSLSRGEDGPLYEASDSLCEQLAALRQVSGALSSLKIIHPSLVHALRKRHATSILARLKVVAIDESSVVRNHVVPALVDESTPAGELPHLLAFARAQATLSSNLGKGSLERCLIDAGARLCATSGEVMTLSSISSLQLQLPQPLWPRTDDGRAARFDFVPDPPPPEWKVVAIPSAALKADVQGWRNFLLGLGVGWFPAVQPSVPSGDWESSSLEAVLDTLIAARDLPRLRALAAAVADRWQKYLRAYCVVGHDNPQVLVINPDGAQPTRLLTALRKRAWLIGSDGQIYRPDQLWSPNGDLRQVLGEGVPYLTASLPEEAQRVLNVRVVVTAQTLLPLFKAWALAPSYTASENQMAAIFRYICIFASDDEEIRAQLCEQPCIWMPQLSAPFDKAGRRSGNFFRPDHLCYRIFNVFGTPEWWKSVYDEQMLAVGSDGYTDCGSGVQLALDSMRSLLTSTLIDEPVLPSANGEFQPLQKIFFYVPLPLPGTPSDADQWSAATLRHAVLVAPNVRELPALSNVYNLEQSLERFYTTVLQLRPLSRRVREAVIARQHEPPIEQTVATHSVWLYAAAGAMQRFCIKHNLNEAQTEKTAATFRSIVLQPVAELSVCREVTSPDGTVIERAAGVDRIAHLSEPVDATESSELTRTLYYTSAVDAEEIGKALLRAIPPEMPDDKLLIVTYVLMHVWAWEGKRSRSLRDEIFASGDKKWQKLPVLPDGVEEWLTFGGMDEAEQQAAAEAEAAAEMERAMRRERAMLTASSQQALVPSVALANEGGESDEQVLMAQLAQLELDPALSSAVQRLRAQMSARANSVGGGSANASEIGNALGVGMGGGGPGGGGGLGGGRPAGSPSNYVPDTDDISGVPIGPRPVVPDSVTEMQSDFGRRDGSGVRGDGGGSNGDARGPRSHASGIDRHDASPSPTHIASTGSARPSSPNLQERLQEPSGQVDVIEWQASQVRPEMIHELGSLDADDAEAVGRWGERVVRAELAQAHELAETGMEVTWVNEFGEKGLPYDVVVAKDGRVDSYVEVKTTKSDDKQLFEVTPAELDMARQMGSAYTICRIFGAGSLFGVRMASLRNPAEHLGGGGLKLYMACGV